MLNSENAVCVCGLGKSWLFLSLSFSLTLFPSHQKYSILAWSKIKSMWNFKISWPSPYADWTCNGIEKWFNYSKCAWNIRRLINRNGSFSIHRFRNVSSIIWNYCSSFLSSTFSHSFCIAQGWNGVYSHAFRSNNDDDEGLGSWIKFSARHIDT